MQPQPPTVLLPLLPWPPLRRTGWLCPHGGLHGREPAGGEHSIDECAWQLGEPPFAIGGGSIAMTPNGDKFVKGDVGKFFREQNGAQWDGSPRFGLGPYVQQQKNF
jgi:hypothetical protein